jgi:hypothetical protein
MGIKIFFIRHAGLWLVPLAILIALIMAESVLRLYPQLLPLEAQIRRLWQLQSQVQSIGDPYLGFVYPAHRTKQIESLDFRFTIESDEHGFRNPSPWPDQADIVVVGDSMVYGWGVERSTSWVGLLEESLAGQRVITLGMPGAVPQQYVRYLEKFGLDLHPKLVIFGIFAGNDVVGAENFESWLASGSPGNYDVWRFFGGKPPSRSRNLLGESQLLLFLQSMKRTMGDAYSSETVKIPDRGSLQLVPAIHKRALAKNHPQDAAFRKVIELAVTAKNLAVANGSEFLVILFPTKEEIYLPLSGVSYPSLTRPLKDALEDQDIRCIDLSERFHESATQNEKLYFHIDGHPNKTGNRIIAGVVIEHLRNALPLPGTETGK